MANQFLQHPEDDHHRGGLAEVFAGGVWARDSVAQAVPAVWTFPWPVPDLDTDHRREPGAGGTTRLGSEPLDQGTQRLDQSGHHPGQTPPAGKMLSAIGPSEPNLPQFPAPSQQRRRTTQPSVPSSLPLEAVAATEAEGHCPRLGSEVARRVLVLDARQRRCGATCLSARRVGERCAVNRAPSRQDARECFPASKPAKRET